MPNAERFFNAVEFLNSKHWVRLMACLGPGVVLNKFMFVAEAPAPFKVGASVLFAAGLLLYVAWPFVYHKVVGVSDNVAPVPVQQQGLTAKMVPYVPGLAHMDLMAELVTMCGGDAAAALQLVSTECQVNPADTYLAAIERAHRRRSLKNAL